MARPEVHVGVRVLLFTGKGGVGTTTTALATAAHAARAGHRTLLLSADAARDLAGGPEASEVEPRLSVMGFGGQSALERSAPSINHALAGLSVGTDADPLAAEELLVLPGVDDILMLFEVGERITGGHWDVVVVDCGPVDFMLRWLALPETVRRYADRILPRHWRMTRRSAAANAEGEPWESSMDGLVGVVAALTERLDDVREALAGVQVSVRLVLTPERQVVDDSRHAAAGLSLIGYRVDEVIANRVVPVDGAAQAVEAADPWRAALVSAQHTALESVRTAFPGRPIRTAPYLPTGPDGPAAGADLASEMYGDTDPVGPPRDPAPSNDARVEREPCPEALGGTEFVWLIPLAPSSREQIAVARVDDDLAVTVSGTRRLIPLPSGLRRCMVRSAAYTSDGLRVRFRPDPALWPKG